MQSQLRALATHLIIPNIPTKPYSSKADANADHTGPWAGQTPTMTNKTTIGVTGETLHPNFKLPIL